MSKKHHKFIRINGKIVKSPPFTNRADAVRWYNEKLREKQHLKEGLPMPLDNRLSLKGYFQNTWLPNRKAAYSRATWASDEQRFRDYVSNSIGHLKIAKINSIQVRHCLAAVVQKHGQSISTRNKVRSLLSKIFGDAMIEETPLRTMNPALGIKFKDPRQGVKRPAHIAKGVDIEKYLSAARSTGELEFAMICTFLMSAGRKSEVIALKWENFDPETNELSIKARFVQAEGRVVAGTKAGRESHRVVNISDALTKVLSRWRKKTKFKGPENFIFSREDGSCFGSRQINHITETISTASGVKASPHALRHSFGRWFVAKGGGLKALQTIMGHSNYKTTELYSELVAEQVKSERNRVSFDLDFEPEKGVSEVSVDAPKCAEMSNPAIEAEHHE